MDAVGSIASAPVDNSIVPDAKQVQNNSVQQSTNVTFSEAQTLDITVTTAEGDKVTLSSSKTAELSLATYNAQGQVDGQTIAVSAQSAEVRRSSDSSVTIEGNLNPEELKQVRQAIHIIQKAERDVLTGHPDKAAAQTAKLAGLDQIASVDADIEFKQQVSVTQTSIQTSPAPDDATATSQTPTPTAEAAAQPIAVPQVPQDVPAATSSATQQQPAVTSTAASAMADTTAKNFLISLGRSTANAAQFNFQQSAAWWIPTGNALHSGNGTVSRGMN